MKVPAFFPLTVSVIASALFAPAALGALENWPLQGAEIRRAFLQFSESGLFNGVEVGGTAPEATAPDQGELIYLFDPATARHQKLPSALGGVVIIAHQENIRSAVTQIVPHPSLRTRTAVGAGSAVGMTLDQTNPKLRLFVFDQQLGTVVNPQMVFPPLPDDRAPLLFDARMISEDTKEPFSLLRQNRAQNGYWTFLLDAGDPSSKDGRDFLRGVFSIEAYHNGAEFFNLKAEALKDKSGVLQFYGLSDDQLPPASTVREGERTWNLGRLFITEGTNIIELTISDFAGNQSSRTFSLRGGRF